MGQALVDDLQTALDQFSSVVDECQKEI